jgi:hypothetical protein
LKIHAETIEEIKEDLGKLKKKVSDYKEPDSI